jgi:hypothetical protein
MNEIPSSPENNDAVNDLPAELGFIESAELLELRDQIKEAIAADDKERIAELIRQYALEGENVVNQKQGEDFPKAQIGLIVAKALIWKEVGRTDDYYPSDINDALMYAEGMGYDEVAKTLREALEKLDSPTIITYLDVAIMSHEDDTTTSHKIAEILRGLGEEYGFDYETCDEIVAMPFEVAFETAYSYLTQAGLDADEILADFVEETEENGSE